MGVCTFKKKRKKNSTVYGIIRLKCFIITFMMSFIFFFPPKCWSKGTNIIKFQEIYCRAWWLINKCIIYLKFTEGVDLKFSYITHT